MYSLGVVLKGTLSNFLCGDCMGSDVGRWHYLTRADTKISRLLNVAKHCGSKYRFPKPKKFFSDARNRLTVAKQCKFQTKINS